MHICWNPPKQKGKGLSAKWKKLSDLKLTIFTHQNNKNKSRNDTDRKYAYDFPADLCQHFYRRKTFHTNSSSWAVPNLITLGYFHTLFTLLGDSDSNRPARGRGKLRPRETIRAEEMGTVMEGKQRLPPFLIALFNLFINCGNNQKLHYIWNWTWQHEDRIQCYSSCYGLCKLHEAIVNMSKNVVLHFLY